MIRLATDENIGKRLLRGLFRRESELDLVRVQDVGLAGADDPTILDWAAAENRVILTHDAETMAGHAYERVIQGRPMPGVVIIRSSAPIGRVLEDLLILATCSDEGEFEGQVRYVPL